MTHLARRTVLALSAAAFFAVAHAQQPLAFQPGENVAILGHALPDRSQHFGWLETFFHQKFADKQLVFRNLAAAGDEVATWHRSENFGTRDEWLRKVKADTIFAFYGFNESFAGYEGIEKFKTDLAKFLADAKSNNYSGKGSPRVVLFSPPAIEKHRDADIADATGNNTNLQNYTAAMAEVAKANGVPFVDLYKASQEIYAAAAAKGESLTVNGRHLTEAGDKALAEQIYRALFGEAAPAPNEKLRAAVNEKNWQWHQRYRTIDGYNVYGGRSALAYQPGKGGFKSDRNAEEPYISNYKTMQREMDMRDVMTANRDARVFAVAKGGDLVVKDDNLPQPITPKTNKPGDKPDESWTYPDGEAAIAKMKVAAGCKINLFADEKQFPELANPVQMAWDTKGRLWVAAWKNYPEREPTSKDGDKLLVFEDTNGDGKADKCSTFMDDLNGPTGFTPWKDGVLVMQAPDLWYVRDTNGDGKADSRERLVMGMDSADSHHTTNALNPDPGGAVYLSDGVFHRTQIETSAGPKRHADGMIWRFEPRTGKIEQYAPYGFANPHGKTFDRWGNDFITDATGNNTYFGPAFSGYLESGKHSSMKQFWERPSRPCPHTWMVSSRHFPDDWQDVFLNCNVIGFQGIYRVKMSDEGSGIRGETIENLVSADPADLPTFRPICVNNGPDGAIYFCDWTQTIIGHMQHHLRDPNRGHQYGRIYRITYEGRPLLKPAKIDGQPIEALLDLLKLPENDTRTLVKVELDKHPSAKVIPAVKKWAAALDKSDKDIEHHLTEALWVHQWHNAVDADLLKRVLRSPDSNARAAATRVLCYWRDRVPDALALLKTQAADESPRPRLQAVRAASFFGAKDAAAAAEIVYAAMEKERDYYLDYTTGETLKQLRSLKVELPFPTTPKAIAYFVGKMSDAELAKAPVSEPVLVARLERKATDAAARDAALTELAKLRNTTRTALLVSLISSSPAAEEYAKQLAAAPASELKAARAMLADTAAKTGSTVVRRACFAALVAADGTAQNVWDAAAKSPATLNDFLTALATVPDPALRATAHDRIRALLAAPAADAKAGTTGRFVRVSLPRKGTLTLAEVEVTSGGANIARNGKATQSGASNSGDALRAIDGNKSGAYNDGGQTHTPENSDSPWWELDLGRDVPVESIEIWNRTDGDLGARLDGFDLAILDSGKREVFSKKGNPAPKESARIAIGEGGGPARAAVRALVSTGKDQPGTFALLTAMIREGRERAAASSAVLVLPRTAWSAPVAAPAAEAILAWAKTIPGGQRTEGEYLEITQAGNELAGILPPADATRIRKELRALGTPVFLIKTVHEQMRYDIAQIVVEPGKNVEIILENHDTMPHNLIVVPPGAHEKAGMAAATMAPDKLDNQGRAFIPKGVEVIAASKLIEAGQSERLKFKAPDAEGTYEYVCTFPGHFALMWGKLVVTKTPDAVAAK